MNKFLKVLYLGACILVIVLASNDANSQESCNNQCSVINQDVNTPVPKALENAEIVVRTKDGKEYKMSANDFKVVPRKQQFKIKERIIYKAQQDFPPPPKKEKYESSGVLMLGLSYDYINLDAKVEPGKVTLYSEKGAVLDLSYYKRKMFGDFGLGVGININGAPKAILGMELE